MSNALFQIPLDQIAVRLVYLAERYLAGEWEPGAAHRFAHGYSWELQQVVARSRSETRADLIVAAQLLATVLIASSARGINEQTDNARQWRDVIASATALVRAEANLR